MEGHLKFIIAYGIVSIYVQIIMMFLKEVVALFGESTYLEIAVNRDKANTLLGIDVEVNTN